MNHLIFTSTLMVIEYKQHIVKANRENCKNTRNISGILLFCKKKATRLEKTEPQARILISLWFCGLFSCPDV